MQILQQRKNIALSINIQAAQSHTKAIDISKHTTGHFIACQRGEIQLHPPEHQQETWQATHQTRLTVRKLHNKQNSTNFQNTEMPPQTQQYKQDEETEEYPAGKGTG